MSLLCYGSSNVLTVLQQKTSELFQLFCMSVLCCATLSRPVQHTNKDRIIQKSEYLSIIQFARKKYCYLIYALRFEWSNLVPNVGMITLSLIYKPHIA